MLKRSLAVLATLVAASALAGCSDDNGDSTAKDTNPTTAAPSTANATGPACEYPPATAPAKEVDPPPDHAAYSGTVDVTIGTSIGDLKASLDADTTPCTVNSFTSLASQGYFDDTTCHRLTTSGIFVLQCGDPSATGSGGPGYSFADELSGDETYPAGTLAMANAGANTNGSQFFIVYGDTLHLDPLYTVFGTIDDASVAIVKAMADEGTADGGPDGAPKTPVDITGVTIG